MEDGADEALLTQGVVVVLPLPARLDCAGVGRLGKALLELDAVAEAEPQERV